MVTVKLSKKIFSNLFFTEGLSMGSFKQESHITYLADDISSNLPTEQIDENCIPSLLHHSSSSAVEGIRIENIRLRFLQDDEDDETTMPRVQGHSETT